MQPRTTTGWATESATATPTLQRVTEAGNLATKAGRFLVTLITPGQGSSGTYSPEVLQQAAAEAAFPAGTQMHVDHATERENAERGVRSVQTLAAVLTENARWDGAGLVAEARPIGPWGQAVKDMSDAIGVSISAAAEFGVSADEDGSPVRVIERIVPHPLNTADFVTVPGRGGSFQVLESAAHAQEQATVATYLEARTHQYLTDLFADMYGEGRLSRPEWDTLQAAAGTAVATITAAIAALPDLTQRGPWADAPTNSPATEARANQGTDPAPVTHNTTSEEDIVPKIEIDEQELTALRESAGRADTLAQENTQLKADAEQRETEAREARVAHAVQVIKEAYGEDAPAFIVEAAKTAAEAGAFDEKAAREAAATLQAREAGKPAGLGHTNEAATPKHTIKDAGALLLGAGK